MICPDARAAPQQAPDVARSQHCSRPAGVVFINEVVKMLGSGRVARRGGSRMTYVIGEACVVRAGPGVRGGMPSGLHLRGRADALHPSGERVDCGACEPVSGGGDLLRRRRTSCRPTPARTRASSPSRCPPAMNRSALPAAPRSSASWVPTRLWSPRSPHSGNRGQRGSEPARRRPPGMC